MLDSTKKALTQRIAELEEQLKQEKARQDDLDSPRKVIRDSLSSLTKSNLTLQEMLVGQGEMVEIVKRYNKRLQRDIAMYKGQNLKLREQIAALVAIKEEEEQYEVSKSV